MSPAISQSQNGGGSLSVLVDPDVGGGGGWSGTSDACGRSPWYGCFRASAGKRPKAGRFPPSTPPALSAGPHPPYPTGTTTTRPAAGTRPSQPPTPRRCLVTQPGTGPTHRSPPNPTTEHRNYAAANATTPRGAARCEPDLRQADARQRRETRRPATRSVP